MDIRNRYAALALAALAALAFWAARRPGRPPERAAVLAVPVAVPPAAPPAKPRRKAVSLVKPPPPPPEPRGARLRDPGEALGGKPPVRVELSTPAVQ